MGATFNTGYLENLILYNGSNNIGIGTSADATYKVTLGGSLLGTSGVFSSSITATGESFITGSDGGGKMLKFTGGTTKFNWMIAAQQNVNNGLEITPSSAAGGSTFSTPAVVVTSGGNVGIGTSSPTNFGAGYTTLSINGSTSGGVLDLMVGDVRALTIATDGSEPSISTRISGQPLVFKTNNAGTVGERLRIASTGAATFSSTIRSNNTYGLAIGDVSSYRRIQYGSDAATSFSLLTDANGYAGLYAGAATFSEGVTISKSSNSGSGSVFPRFQVENTLATQGDGSSTFNFADIRIASGNSAVQMFLGTTYAAGTWAPAGIINVSTNHDLQIKTNNTERMRITSGGYLKVSNNGVYNDAAGAYHEIIQTATGSDLLYSKHTAASPYGMEIYFSGASPNNATNWFVYYYDATTLRAKINSNGGLANFSANNVNLASDIRLKKDIVPLSSEWNKLKQIEVVNYRYKDSTDETALYGAIAQQVKEIYPELVIVTREATETEPEYYGLREQPFQWITTKVLQEAMTKIEEQQQQIEELKAKLN